MGFRSARLTLAAGRAVVDVVVRERGEQPGVRLRRQQADAAAGLRAEFGVTEEGTDVVEDVVGDRRLAEWRPVHLLDVEVEVVRIDARQTEVDLAPEHLEPT